ncbi:MAG: hypothetical protein ACERKK_11295 [Poseidonibacter sp.]|uniref:hypothetical protein n=2 Tax=Poseidonibacter sp. TaxID=2321188 RepID=UPI00359D51D9
MISILNKHSLYHTFNVKDFNYLEEAINSMAPSMVEYYLKDLCEDNDDNIYLNRRDIENTLVIGEYSLYIDYSENIYLEIDNDFTANQETTSFW